MIKDLNLKEKKCCDDLCNNAGKEEELNSDQLQEHIQQEFSQMPVHLREQFLNELCKHPILDTNETPIVFTITRKKVAPKKKLIFGCRISVKELTLLILEIDKEIHLFYDCTLVPVFVAMLMSTDLSQWNIIFHLKCTTTEFKCIMEHLSLHCKSFNPATIQRTKAFISSQRTLINASYLYNTSTEHLHNKGLIAYIFSKYC